MQIVTLTCDSCGTVVAGNVLADTRSAVCPGVGCSEILRLEDLMPEEQEIVREELRDER